MKCFLGVDMPHLKRFAHFCINTALLQYICDLDDYRLLIGLI